MAAKKKAAKKTKTTKKAAGKTAKKKGGKKRAAKTGPARKAAPKKAARKAAPKAAKTGRSAAKRSSAGKGAKSSGQKAAPPAGVPSMLGGAPTSSAGLDEGEELKGQGGVARQSPDVDWQARERSGVTLDRSLIRIVSLVHPSGSRSGVPVNLVSVN